MGKQLIKRKYSQDIRDLADIESGWHFGALKASEESWQIFASRTWRKDAGISTGAMGFTGLMLTANSQEAWRKRELMQKETSKGWATSRWKAEYWRDCDDEFMWKGHGELRVTRRMAKRRKALLKCKFPRTGEQPAWADYTKRKKSSWLAFSCKAAPEVYLEYFCTQQILQRKSSLPLRTWGYQSLS